MVSNGFHVFTFHPKYNKSYWFATLPRVVVIRFVCLFFCLLVCLFFGVFVFCWGVCWRVRWKGCLFDGGGLCRFFGLVFLFLFLFCFCFFCIWSLVG